jgi:hypothetical protein
MTSAVNPATGPLQQAAPLHRGLIALLSSFGLVMAIATVYVIPPTLEPIAWLAIFLVCAFAIAKRCSGRFFAHGFLVCLVNSVWMTGARVLLIRDYLAWHADEAAMMLQMPMATSPRLMVLITGPVIGVLSGIALGIFAFVASKLVKRP